MLLLALVLRLGNPYTEVNKPGPVGNIPMTPDDVLEDCPWPPFENLSAPGHSAYAAAVALNPKEYA